MTEKYYAAQYAWINCIEYNFMIVDKADKQRVGIISIRKIDKDTVWDIATGATQLFKRCILR